MTAKKRSRRKRKSVNPFLAVFLGIVVLLASKWSYQLWEIDQATDAQKNKLLEQRQELLADNEKLRKEVEKLNTPSYIEQLAREKLGLVKKGEIVIAPKKSDE